MIRRIFSAVVALCIVYAAFWVAQGRIDQDSLYSLLILIGLVLVIGVLSAIRGVQPPRIRHRSARTYRRYRACGGDLAASDDSDVARLRREWQVDRYDPCYEARHAQSASRWDNADYPVINPATGLMMMGGIGGLDASGHSYGTGFADDNLNHWHRNDETIHRHDDDAFRSFDNSAINSWDH